MIAIFKKMLNKLDSKTELKNKIIYLINSDRKKNNLVK